MNKDAESTVKKMEKQRQAIERKKQYDSVTGLGWKGFGIAFLAIVIAVNYILFSSVNRHFSRIRIDALTNRRV